MTQVDSLDGWGDRRLKLEQLRAFVAIAEDGGIQRAGERLSRTQSAMTQSLQRLEQIVGYRLVERRQGHVLGLTDAGRRFLDPARDIVARADEAIDVLRRPSFRGRVRLGIPDDYPVTNLTGAIARCLDRSPALRVETVSALSADLYERFRRCELDLVILKSLGPETPAGATLYPLQSEPLLWVHRGPIRRDQTASVPLVAFPSGCVYRRAACAGLSTVDHSYYFSYVSHSYDNIRAAISAGLGVGVLPVSALSADHHRLSVEAGFPSLPEVHLSLLLWPGDGLAQAFAQEILPGMPR